jgi:GAF domain-containing protein
VIPVIVNGQVAGVFDIDSPHLNRFSAEDQQGLEALLAEFINATDFPTL